MTERQWLRAVVGLIVAASVGAGPYRAGSAQVAASPASLGAEVGEPSISVEGQIHLGADSMFVRVDSPFLWEDGDQNLALGDWALSIPFVHGTSNLAIGHQAMYIVPGSRNTALGNFALAGHFGGGDHNTAVGYGALFEGLEGDQNTAVGYGSLFRTAASHNTGVGWEALFENESGVYNNAFGWRALRDNNTGDRNTALGAAAMKTNTSGSENTAVGVDAAFWNTAGSRNTAIGRLALHSNTQGSDNIALGYRAGIRLGNGNTVPDTELNDNIFIGSRGEKDDSGTIRIGAGAHTATYIAGIKDQAVFWTEGVPVFVDNSGKLGTSVSSRRYKEDIELLGEVSTALLSLRPVSYRYRESLPDGSKPIQFGLIAEEVAEVLPELVAVDEHGRPEAVKYHLLSTLLLNELQKQTAQIDRQERRLARQEVAIADLRRELETVGTAGAARAQSR